MELTSLELVCLLIWAFFFFSFFIISFKSDRISFINSMNFDCIPTDFSAKKKEKEMLKIEHIILFLIWNGSYFIVCSSNDGRNCTMFTLNSKSDSYKDYYNLNMLDKPIFTQTNFHNMTFSVIHLHFSIFHNVGIR